MGGGGGASRFGGGRGGAQFLVPLLIFEAGSDAVGPLLTLALGLVTSAETSDDVSRGLGGDGRLPRRGSSGLLVRFS